MPEQTTTKTVEINQDDSPTRKLAAAVLGAIVVIVFILLLILGIQAIRNLLARKQTATQPVLTTNYTTPTIPNSNLNTTLTGTSSSQVVTYKTMPATGPREDAVMVFVLIAIAGGPSLVVLSKKIS